jgi:hypothetical protein
MRNIRQFWHNTISRCHRNDRARPWHEWMLRNVVRVCPKSGRFVGFRFRQRWLWPIVGVAALAWFLIRVIPKPARATYPCQQWVAPVAAGFVGWLLSLIGAAWAFRKVGHLLRRKRLAIAFAFFLLGSSAVVWNACSVSRDAAASTPTDAPNTPIGTARGIYPGRVVWSRDAAAAHWSQAASTHWWDPDQTDQTRVNAMLSEGLRSLTGAASDSTAWDALFRTLNQRRGNGDIGYQQAINKKIVIKINQNAANESNNNNYAKNGCNNENCITANPHLIYALLGQLVQQAGVAESDITVYDASGLNRGWGGPRTIGDNIYTYNHAAFPSVHFMDGVGLQGRELAAWPASESVHYATGNGGDETKGKKIVQRVLDAGYLINMAIMKHHGDGPTLCAKNHYGTVDGQRHGPMYGNSSYYSNFVELMGHQDLGEKTLLFMIDTLYGASGPNNVPSKWAQAPFSTSWPSSVFLSQDGVAIDSVGWDFLNAEWGMPQNTDYHLHDAAYIPGADEKKLSGVRYAPNVGSTAAIGSLGVHEHWNNAGGRLYSRNLGTGNGIDLFRAGTKPTCSITAPADGAVIAAPADMTITATAAAVDHAMAKVEFYQGATKVGEKASGPYSVSWNSVPPGQYTLTARAYDNVGTAGDSAPLTVTVIGPPAVTGDTTTSNRTPPWTWSTTGGTGTGTYRYQLDSTAGPWIQTTAVSYTPAFTLADGDHTLYVQERDGAGAWTASGSFTTRIAKASATVVLGNLAHYFDGTPKSATATTTPPGLNVDLTYDGSPTAPTNVGNYAVVATINDAAYQGSASAVLMIAPGGSDSGQALPPDADADGDGFSDEIEAALGSDPNSAAATPADVGEPTAIGTLSGAKLAIKLSFSKPNSDSIVLSGLLLIPDGFHIAGQKVIVDIGGVVKLFELSAKGASPKGNDSMVVRTKSSKGVVMLQVAKFSLKLTKGAFAAPLAAVGLANETVAKKKLAVPITVIFNGEVLRKAVPQTYKAVVKKGGAAK